MAGWSNGEVVAVKGAMMGSALGDTIGLFTEFMSREQASTLYTSFSLVDPATELHNDSHRARFDDRAWTDDTDHAILIMLSYLRNQRLVPEDFAARLRSWCEQGLRCLDRLPMGLGNTIGRVVLDKQYLSDPIGTALAHWRKSNYSLASNGSLMRTTPIGIIGLTLSEPDTFNAAILIGSVTHADHRCAISAAAFAGLIRGLCLSQIRTQPDIDALLDRAWTHTTTTYTIANSPPPSRTEFNAHVHADSLDALALCTREMGYVYKALGAGIWCLRRAIERGEDESFKSLITQLVMCGGDTDTNATVAGALLGAYFGYDALPSEWKDGMRHRDWFLGKVDALLAVVRGDTAAYDPALDTDTELDGGKGFLDQDELKRREMLVMERILTARQSNTILVPLDMKKKHKWWNFWP